MLKKDARSLIRKKRNEMSETDKMKFDDLLLIQFQSLQLPDLNYVLSFYPMEDSNETDTFLITDYLHFKNPNLQICYPRIDMQNKTIHAIVCHADSIFEANDYNIPEPKDLITVDPEELDLVLVPLMAFDLNGNRAGYGKGFYDRFLKNCRKDCFKVGLSYFEPVDSIDDASEFDVPLELCITPHRIYVF